MQTVRPSLLAFNAGLLDPKLRGRMDLDIYARGLQVIENFIVTPQGASEKRRGFNFVATAKAGNLKVLLIPFVFSTTQAYMLEFGHQYMRVHMNRGQVVTNVDTLREACEATTNWVGDGVVLQAGCAVDTDHTQGTYSVKSTTASGGSGGKKTAHITKTLAQNWSAATHLLLDIKRVGFASNLQYYVSFGEVTIGVEQHKFYISPPTASATPNVFTTYLLDISGIPAADRDAVIGIRVGVYLGNDYTWGAGDGLKVDNINTRVATPVEIATPWTTAQLSDLRWVQNADTFFFTHPDTDPVEITRSGHTVWTLSYSYHRPPATAELPWYPSGTVTPGAATGMTVTFTASVAVFQSGDINRQLLSISGGRAIIQTFTSTTQVVCDILESFGSTSAIANGSWWLSGSPTGLLSFAGTNKVGANLTVTSSLNSFRSTDTTKHLFTQFGILRIFNYISATQVKGEILLKLDPKEDTWVWSMESPVWNATQKYPRTLAFYEQRLLFGGSPGFPHNIWASRIGSFFDQGHGPLDSDAIHRMLVSNEVHTFRWMIPTRVLMIGTNSGIWRVSGAGNEPMTPANCDARIDNNVGAYNVPSVRINNVVLFIAAGGEQLFDIVYDLTTDSFSANDRNLPSGKLFTGGVTSLAIQKRPFVIVWTVGAEGALWGLTYEPSEKVIAWHKHTTGDEELSAGSVGLFKYVAILPTDTGDDEVWATVLRNGILCIEVMSIPWTDQKNICYSDCSLRYSGESTSYLSGASLLATVKGNVATIDGSAYVGISIDAYGGAALPVPGADVTLGVPFPASLIPMPLEASVGGGQTTQQLLKRITEVGIKTYKTGSFQVGWGINASYMASVEWRSIEEFLNAPNPLLTGQVRVPVFGDFDEEISIAIRSNLPLPCTILTIHPEWLTESS